MAMALGQSVLPFVHPGLAWAALLAGLTPVLIHLISRRRYARTPWAAMAFLVAANRRSTRRMRFEHWLLMCMRIGVILLLGAAVARPFLPASGLLPSSFSRMHRIVVLDNSLSMNANGSDGRTRLAMAQEAAANLLASLPPDDAVSLVSLASPAEAPIAQAAYDRRWVRETFAGVTPTQGVTDVVGATRLVERMLKDSPAATGNREVYFVSDFARQEWRSATARQPTAAAAAMRQLASHLENTATSLNLIRVEDEVRDNVAITKLVPETSLIGVNVPVRLMVEVTNYGTTTLRNISLQVRRGGLILRREALPNLGPGSSTVTSVTTEFATPGTHAIDARITTPEGNSLEEDDVRYLSLEAVEQRAILLVDGRPGARTLDGKAGFLAVALAPGAELTPSLTPAAAKDANLFAPKVIAESQLEAEVLDSYDAVALCDVARLPQAHWTRLERFVRRGGGLLVALGELVSVDSYNRMGFADGRGLLSGRLGRVVESGQTADASPWKLDAHPHAVVAEFAGEPNSGLFRARVDRYVAFEPDLRRAEVALRFADGAAALVASKFGQGSVMAWTTSSNMEWTNLPAKGDFVGLVHNIFSSLVPQRGIHRDILVGQTVREPLTPAQTAMALSVRDESGAGYEPALVSEGDALAMAYGPVAQAQFLTLSIGVETRAVAVNVDTAESDLAVAGESELATALGIPVRIVSHRALAEQPPSAARSTELASFSLYAVMILLLGELWMAMHFAVRGDMSPAASGRSAASRITMEARDAS